MNKPYSYFDRLRRARPAKARRRRQGTPAVPNDALQSAERNAVVLDPESVARITRAQPVAEF